MALPARLTAQDSSEPPALSSKTSEELPKLQPLTDAKNWDAALGLLNGLLAGVPPTSYDAALLSDIKAKILMQKNDYAAAIAPMENALRLGETYKYFQQKQLLELVDYLARIYYQEATTSKSPAVQQQYFAKAADYMKRQIAEMPKPTYEVYVFYASVLYNRAIANPDKPDRDLLMQSLAEIDKGLMLEPRPKEQLYQLKLAVLQQVDNFPAAADVLELLVEQYPTNRTYWLQLTGIYLNLQKDIRAILTIERAQALGLMKTPKDNFQLVGIYYNMGQFSKACALLSAGLKDGSIEPEQKNYELLAYAYQQINRELDGIAVLKDAAKRFPKAGGIDFQIAQMYYGLDQGQEAYNYIKSAIAKGNLERLASAYGFYAYAAFEQQKLDEALEAINKALALPDGAKDKQLPSLKKAVEDAIKERNSRAEIEAEKAKAPAKS